MDYERGDTREQVTGRQRNLQSVELEKLSYAIVVITVKNEAWWSGLNVGAGEQSGVATECVDPGGSSRQKFE